MYLGPSIGIRRRHGGSLDYAILVTVPVTLYVGLVQAIVVNVSPGTPWTLTVDGESAASGTGTGTSQNAMVTVTAAMVGIGVAVVLSTPRSTASDTVDVINIDTLLAGKSRAWYDDSTALAAGQWNDKSGNARHSVTLAGALGSTTVNGRRATNFDGATKSGTNFTSALPQEWWVVGRFDNAFTAIDFMCAAWNGPSIRRHAAGELRFTSLNSWSAVPGYTLAGHLLVARFVATASGAPLKEFYLNGILYSNTGGNITAMGGVTLGAGFNAGTVFLTGPICEYNQTNILSASDGSYYQEYLMLKWGALSP